MMNMSIILAKLRAGPEIIQRAWKRITYCMSPHMLFEIGD